MYQARDNGTFINELRSQSINLTVEEKKTKLMSLAIYFTSYILNMFRILIYPSSGAWDCAVELPHRSFSLQHGHYSKPAVPNLQHKTNREQNDRCGNSTAQSQAPDDGYINIRNMLSI